MSNSALRIGFLLL